MKNTLAFFLPPLLIATIIFFAFQFFVLRPTEKGALQVTASPESEVYLNDKYIGKTPLCKCPLPNKSGKESSRDLLQAGNYTIKLVPVNKEFSTYSDSIVIRKSLLTVVDRKFAEGAKSEGSIITLESIPDKTTSQILVTTIPDKTEVFLDDAKSGDSPLLIRDVPAAKHDLRIRKDGYEEKVIPLLATNGYKLLVTAYLGVDDQVSTSPTPSASPSSKLSPTPTGDVVTVEETPTGFLRVREDATVGSTEIGRVAPGDVLPLVDELSGWYKIQMPNGTEGWISSQYARKKE